MNLSRNVINDAMNLIRFASNDEQMKLLADTNLEGYHETRAIECLKHALAGENRLGNLAMAGKLIILAIIYQQAKIRAVHGTIG